MAAPLPTPSAPQTTDRVVVIEKPRRRRWPWIVGILLILGALVYVGLRLMVTHAEPLLRARVIQTLSARFNSRVDLASLDVSVSDGLNVSGRGLKIFGKTDPNPTEPGFQPLLEVEEFRFHTGVKTLLYVPMHVETVYVKGMTVNIPPKEQRDAEEATADSGPDTNEAAQPSPSNEASPPQSQSGQKSPAPSKKQSRLARFEEARNIRIVVDHFVCQDTRLIINTLKPGKQPLEFDISSLNMKDVGPGQPLHFEATLLNPKPQGDIQSSGDFGPFDLDTPRNTPLSGDYTFTHADLGTLKGIGGLLSSTGKYSGRLGKITVDGTTDTPDFRLAIAGHPVPLHTQFHAIVDGTDGDTYLQPVKAKLLQSSFTASGKIVRVKDPKGHDIELDVVLDHARIEDMLKLGVRTDPPVMTGPFQMKAKMSLPPGEEDVANRLKLSGTFRIPQAVFTSDKVQDRIDSLSLRSQGKAKEASQEAKAGTQTTVPSDISGTFDLGNGMFSFSKLDFNVPGTHANVEGQYSLDGNIFDFHGTIRLNAKVSQMMTGWKSILLKPVDPFFAKNGAGTEVPFKVTGTKDEPHIGLDFGRKDTQHEEKNSGEKSSQEKSPPKESQ